MESSTTSRDQARRRPLRQWLGIELSAYALLGVFGVTEAWENSYVSGLLVLVLWVIVGCLFVLWVRGIYRKIARASPENDASGSI